MTPAVGWCRSSRGSTSKPFTNPGAPEVAALPPLSLRRITRPQPLPTLPAGHINYARRRPTFASDRIASRLLPSVMIENKRRSRQESLMKFLAAVIWRLDTYIMMIILPNVHLFN
jgi:hypothetical protein